VSPAARPGYTGPTTATLGSADVTVTLRLDRFGMRVANASGRVMLDTFDGDSTVAGDDVHAYGALGATYHDTLLLPSLIEGWDHVQGTDQPWRHAVRVASTSSVGAAGASLDLFDPADQDTTLHVDLAVRRFDEIPRAALVKAGFSHEGRHPHSDNWRSPGSAPRPQRTAIQFTAEDVGIDAAVTRARSADAGGFHLRVAAPADLLLLKLAAAQEPSRRPSKRRQDLLDVVTLAEDYPDEARTVQELERRVERLSATLLRLGRSRGPER
jgi:hypothetical protein